MGLNERVLKSRGKLKSTTTVNESSPSIGLTSRDMETFEPLTGQLFPEWKSCAAGSLAKISALPESELGSMGNAQDSGVNTSEPFAHFDPDTSSWKTYQVCLLTNTWDVFSETWPRSGMTQNGQCFLRAPLVRHICGKGCSLWPTPTASAFKQDVNDSGEYAQRRAKSGQQITIALAVKLMGNQSVCGNLNPQFLEWLMGYPIGWTALEDSVTPSSRKSRNGSAGKS